MAEQDEVAALVAERAGYVERGLKDRLAEVDEQLRLRGYGPDGEPLPARPPPAKPGKRRRA